nr:thermonuclease family protein [Salinibacter ruber]
MTGSVVAEGKETSGREDVGRALICLGLAWQDQRGPSSARLRSLEQKARREEVGLWQQASLTPPWAWRE